MIYALVTYYVIVTGLTLYTKYTDVDYYYCDSTLGKAGGIFSVILLGWVVGIPYMIDEYHTRKRKTPEEKENDRARVVISKFSNKAILVALQKTYPEEFL